MKRIFPSLCLLCLCGFQAFAEDAPPAEKIAENRKAAEQGEAQAQYSLGIFYQEGVGVTKDAEEVVKWFRKAAEQGNAKAQYVLGLCYANGEGVTKDDIEVVKWWRMAAEQGETKAQYHLGLYYEKGKGMPKDEVEAVKWFRKAAEQGSAAAQFNLGLTTPTAKEWQRMQSRPICGLTCQTRRIMMMPRNAWMVCQRK